MTDDLRHEIITHRIAFGAVVGVIVAVVVGVLAGLLGVALLALPAAVAAGVMAPLATARNTRPQIVEMLESASPRVDVPPRLANVVSGLAPTVGVAEPEVIVIDDAGADSLTLADDDGATLIVTRGLVDALGLVDLEGVIAHELAHIRRGDAQRAVAVLSTWGWPALQADRQAAGLSAFPGAKLVADPSRKAMLSKLTPEREALADLAAASVTRYPPGLAAGLEKAAAIGSAQEAGRPRSLAPLWLQSSGLADPQASVTKRSIDERIETLREL